MPRGHLTLVERGQIQALLRQGLTQAAIARELGRCRSVICREVKRNGACRNKYRGERAQRRYARVRKNCVPHKRLDHKPLWRFVIDMVTSGWTPEQVAAMLPKLYPDDLQMRVSHETIYQSIYNDTRLRFLIRYLPQSRPKRRRRGQGKKRRGPAIPNRVGIEKRPKVVEERSRFGDWEGDLIVGTNQDGFITTLVDRKSRRLEARKAETKKADEIAQAVIDALQDLPVSWVKTITFDNGTEFARHEDMAKVLPVDIYFADPYASYQRGTNENTNGLIRRYLPKGTSFRNLTQQQLDRITEELNNRPRKCLGYRTPNQVFQEHRHKWRVAFGS